MSKPAWGTKRVCPSCGGRFYDLGRTPITCPVCQAVYQVNPPPSRRGESALPVEVRKAQPVEVRSLAKSELEASTLETGAETGIQEDEELVHLRDDAVEIPGADDEVAFVEDEEEGEADAPGLSVRRGKKTKACALTSEAPASLSVRSDAKSIFGAVANQHDFHHATKPRRDRGF